MAEMRVLELEIDQYGRIRLPEFLLKRLCLRNSLYVPLFAASAESFLMPSAFSAMLLEGTLEETEETIKDLQTEAYEDRECTNEEIVTACKELRRPVNRKKRERTSKGSEYTGE